MAKTILGKVAITLKGEYDETVTYEKLDVVTHSGSSYVAKKETRGNSIDNEEFWQLIAKCGTNGIDGKDYALTDEDKENIKKEITDDANSEFNTNVNEQTEAINTLVTNKEKEINELATTKKTEIETLVTDSKSEIATVGGTQLSDISTLGTTQLSTIESASDGAVSAINSTSETAINDYNANHDTKLKAYNDNDTEKTNAYNDNHNAKMKAYDDNATAQTTTFDTHVTEKTEAFDIHVNDKKLEITTHTNSKIVEVNSAGDSKINEINNSADNLLNYASDMDNLADLNSASGETVTVNDARDYKLFGLKATSEKAKQTTTTGKQLFDENYVAGYDTGGGTFNASSVCGHSEQKIFVASNLTKYFYVRANDNIVINRLFISEFQEDGTFIKRSTPSFFDTKMSKEDVKKYNVNFDSNCNYFMISLYTVKKLVDSEYVKQDFGNFKDLISVCISDEELQEYERYTGGKPSPSPDYPQQIETVNSTIVHINDKTVEIDLQGNEIVTLNDTIKDELVVDKSGNVSLVKNTLKINLADLNFTADNHQNYYSSKYASKTKSNGLIISNIYQYSNTIWESGNKIGIATNKNIWITNDKEFASTNDFLTMLREKNAIAYLQLETPEIIDLGTIPQLRTFAGTNTIFIESNLKTKLDVTYCLDIKKYVDSKHAEEMQKLNEIQELLSSTQTAALLTDNLESDLRKEVNSL